MRQCPLCGGDIEEGVTTYTVDLKYTLDPGDQKQTLIIVRNVPAEICSQCGAEWITPNTTKILQKITRDVREKEPELEIVVFEEAA